MAALCTDNCIQCRKDTKMRHWVEVWDNHKFSKRELDIIREDEPFFKPENTRHCFFLCNPCFKDWRKRQPKPSRALTREDAVIDIARKKGYDVRREGTPLPKE